MSGSWQFTGNARAVAALGRAVAADSVFHAYLFTGPEHTGKATLAVRLAQALNCTAPLVEDGIAAPCLKCSSCRRISEGKHPDVHTVTVEAEEDGPAHKAISVEQMRDTERSVALNPFEGRYRVLIFDPADAMSTEAQNAFLKTLEEPPGNVVFALVTARDGRLLETVRSRCQRLELGFSSVQEIESALAETGMRGNEASLIARLARGRPGWALAAARDEGALEKRRATLEAGSELARLPLPDRMQTAERMSDEFKRNREPVLDRLLEWQSWWRDVLLVQSGAGAGVSNVDMVQRIEEDAAQYERDAVAAFLRSLMDARQQLEENVQSRLALEALVLRAPRASAKARQGPAAG